MAWNPSRIYREPDYVGRSAFCCWQRTPVQWPCWAIGYVRNERKSPISGLKGAMLTSVVHPFECISLSKTTYETTHIQVK